MRESSSSSTLRPDGCVALVSDTICRPSSVPPRPPRQGQLLPRLPLRSGCKPGRQRAAYSDRPPENVRRKDRLAPADVDPEPPLAAGGADTRFAVPDSAPGNRRPGDTAGTEA